MQTEHAVVLGGSIAGLLAAHTLAQHFEHVTVVERDIFPPLGEPRKGVPQSLQLHALLAGGRRALESMFPDFAAGLVAHGALDVDVGTCGDFLVAGRPLTRGETGLRCWLMSRPLLEGYLRQRVLAASNIQTRQGWAARGLVGDREAITGVQLTRAQDQEAETLSANLIVDATGRGSRTPEWLKQLGATPPEQESVTVGLHYVSFTIRREPQHLGGDDVWVDNPHPSSRRTGAALALEGNRYVIALTGYLDEPMPTNFEQALQFAKTLRDGKLYELLTHAQPLTEPRSMRFAASQRRRYERLPKPPRGLLVAGDALCSFNALYGQGMTVAACEARALDTCLRAGTEQLVQRYHRAAAKLVDVPWSIVVGGDLAFEGVQGQRSLATSAMNTFFQRLAAVAPDDKHVSDAFLRVMHLCAPPSSLFAPSVLWRLLRPRGRADTPAPARLANTPSLVKPS